VLRERKKEKQENRGIYPRPLCFGFSGRHISQIPYEARQVMTLLWICRCHFQGARETRLFPWIGDNCPARWLTDRPPLLRTANISHQHHHHRQTNGKPWRASLDFQVEEKEKIKPLYTEDC
jgi:hypothetical protein